MDLFVSKLVDRIAFSGTSDIEYIPNFPSFSKLYYQYYLTVVLQTVEKQWKQKSSDENNMHLYLWKRIKIMCFFILFSEYIMKMGFKHSVYDSGE